VTSVAITPDGTRAVTGSGLRDGPIIRPIKDNSARVWDLATGRQLALLKGHADSVSTVAVTSDGTQVVTGSQDGTVRLWDASTGTELSIILSGGVPIQYLAVARDNSVLVLLQSGLIKSARILPFGQALIDDSIRAVPRCMTPSERQQFYLTAAPPSWCMRLSKWPYDRIGALDTGFRLIVAGRENEAEVLLSAVRSHHPDLVGSITRVWTKSYLARGKTLLEQGKDVEGEQEFARALSRDAAIAEEIKQAWIDTYIARGRAHLKKDELSEADARFNEAMQRDPSVSTQIENLKREHIERQVSISLRRMQALLEQAARGESSDRALTEALATADAALRFQNDHPEVLMFRGLVHMARNNLDAALSDLNNAITNGIRIPPAYFARGLCNEKMGKKDAAIADFQAVLAAEEITDLVKTLQAQAKERLVNLVGRIPPEIQLPQAVPLRK
jgi:tetratricopeptide (TPR) repeat protein